MKDISRKNCSNNSVTENTRTSLLLSRHTYCVHTIKLICALDSAEDRRTPSAEITLSVIITPLSNINACSALSFFKLSILIKMRRHWIKLSMILSWPNQMTCYSHVQFLLYKHLYAWYLLPPTLILTNRHVSLELVCPVEHPMTYLAI